MNSIPYAINPFQFCFFYFMFEAFNCLFLIFIFHFFYLLLKFEDQLIQNLNSIIIFSFLFLLISNHVVSYLFLDFQKWIFKFLATLFRQPLIYGRLLSILPIQSFSFIFLIIQQLIHQNQRFPFTTAKFTLIFLIILL